MGKVQSTLKRDATLEAMNVDDLGRMVMALVQEVWVMRDRMAITEKLLEAQGGPSAAAIEGFVQDPETRAELERLRDIYVQRVLGAPLAARERTVDDILARGGFPRSVPTG